MISPIILKFNIFHIFRVEMNPLEKNITLVSFFIQLHSKTKTHRFFVSFLRNLWSNDLCIEIYIYHILWLCKNKNHCL